MALTSKQKTDAMRSRMAAAGMKERLRGIYMTAEEDAILKPRVKRMLKRLRNGRTER